MPETLHPFDPEDAAAIDELRAQLARGPKMRIAPAARAKFDEMSGRTPVPDGVACERGELAGVAGWWVRPGDARGDAALLYLHGGGWVIGSATPYRGLAGQLAVRAGAAAFVAEYALAPERPFPAAFDDACAVFDALHARFRRVALVGDSAGGNLALAGLLARRAAAAGALALSPNVDLTQTSSPRDAQDPMLSAEVVAEGARQYLAGHDARDPRASPSHGDLRQLPPIWLCAGEDEVLLDPLRAFVAAVDAAGSRAELHTWRGMHHVFPSRIQLAASRAALALAGAALRAMLR
ncbi:MAG TPA: alpha/beta hydrolase fold domain-containing protein [Kofleriaceae bacterium]|nr:alpha/beta hydrolase fold domain-containing protein [Kofleriaceae bacterium]